ncbi:hypothetical protein pVco7_gp063 [Vibrio phage pVco-7]|uniref:J domain-containing protein n=1 Tax=Vibrio phage pVco-5 TaxID=1965485 RepID=A0A1W6JUX1_9CAUD|nr:hypothetical protein KNT61_gp064 [Vibrio phage pVco-5]ARM71052.1 hypothetical protein pVco5_064 [Vibrio phage pVco-5]
MKYVYVFVIFFIIFIGITLGFGGDMGLVVLLLFFGYFIGNITLHKDIAKNINKIEELTIGINVLEKIIREQENRINEKDILIAGLENKRNPSNLNTLTAYEWLGLDPINTDTAKIKTQFKRLSTMYHPDKGGSNKMQTILVNARDELLNNIHKGTVMVSAKCFNDYSVVIPNNSFFYVRYTKEMLVFNPITKNYQPLTVLCFYTREGHKYMWLNCLSMLLDGIPSEIVMGDKFEKDIRVIHFNIINQYLKGMHKETSNIITKLDEELDEKIRTLRR